MALNSDITRSPRAEPEGSADIWAEMETAIQTAMPLPVANGSNDAVFDAWLRHQLAATHDRVLQEPIPDRLLQILEGPRGN